MTKEEKYISILPRIHSIISDERDETARMANIAAVLHSEFGFWWTGFYRVSPDNDLLLGPFHGPVACMHISYGKGVCGTAWSEKRTIVVPDVEKFPGHIACSSQSRSEIVVPCWNHGKITAVLDIDSKDLDNFDDIDRKYLEIAAALLYDYSSFGDVTPAGNIKGFTLPAYDVSVVAGFPVPLDNDERSQDIDILQLLCPHPEACYLVRVQGDSMIDAGICSGDIVIVDKSRRNPSEKEIAVCELNGEFTLKRILVEKDGSKWLVPANPNFPRFPITVCDAFSIWGVVTYIIHKSRD